MQRHTIATLIAAFAMATVLPGVAGAQQSEPRKHVRHHPAPVQYVAAPGPYYYGMPGTYYPAPPFPFFLVPGPWWLPSHP
jgi:hypothetical protein